MQDFFAESVTTRLVVPEGSSDVHVALGRLTAEVSDNRTFTYLDTMIGRPTKIIKVRALQLLARSVMNLHLSKQWSAALETVLVQLLPFSCYDRL